MEPTNCKNCNSRNINKLENEVWECYDCGQTFDTDNVKIESLSMRFHIFDKLLHVQTDSGNHSIATDSENFEVIRDSLIRGDFELVDTLIRSEHSLNIKHLTVGTDDEYYFKDHAVPTSICDLLVTESVSSLAVLNFWINRTVKNESVDASILLNMLGKSIFPVDKSGFLFLSDQPIDGPEFFHCNLSKNNKAIFENGLDGLCQHFFKKQSKKLTSICKKQLFRNKEIDNSFFDTAQFIAEYQPNADLDTVVRLIDSPLVDAIKGNQATIRTVANLLGAVFNGDKLIRLLDDKSQFLEFKNNFDIIADSWKTLEGKIGLKKKYQNFSDLILFLTLEAKKERNADFELKQELSFPWIIKMIGTVSNLNLKVCQSKYELLEWSTVLGNCLDRYPDRVRNGDLMIVGLMDANGIVKYAVEIKPDGSIGYFEGKSRSSAPSSLKATMKTLISKSMT